MTLLSLTPRQRHELFHIQDMLENPKRHSFLQTSYSRHELDDKCAICWQEVKNNFRFDYCNERAYRI